MEIKLWVKAKDVVSEFTGIVASITKYLTGCDRVALVPEVSAKDWQQVLWESYTFDINSVIVLDDGVSSHFAPKEKEIKKPRSWWPETYKTSRGR